MFAGVTVIVLCIPMLVALLVSVPRAKVPKQKPDQVEVYIERAKTAYAFDRIDLDDLETSIWHALHGGKIGFDGLVYEPVPIKGRIKTIKWSEINGT